jgi:hypothetical protein
VVSSSVFCWFVRFKVRNFPYCPFLVRPSSRLVWFRTYVGSVADWLLHDSLDEELKPDQTRLSSYGFYIYMAGRTIKDGLVTSLTCSSDGGTGSLLSSCRARQRSTTSGGECLQNEGKDRSIDSDQHWEILPA